MFASHENPMGLMISLAVIAAVVLLRNRRARRLRIELLWVRPAIFVAIMASSLAAMPPPVSAISIALLATGLALGCALGWQRGRFMRIDIDPDTHALSTRASPAGLIFIIVLLAVRYSLGAMMRENATTMHLPILAVIDAFVLLSGATMSVQGLEMWLRARRLLAQTVAEKGHVPPRI